MWPDHHLQTHNENDDDGGDRVEVDDGGDTDNNDDDIHAKQNSSNLKMCSNGSVPCVLVQRSSQGVLYTPCRRVCPG